MEIFILPVESLTFLETYGFMMARLVVLASLTFVKAEIKKYACPMFTSGLKKGQVFAV